MRLLIVSHTPHYLRENRLVGWGATVRELNYLAGLFESVTHIAPVYKGAAPTSAMEYTATNLKVRPVAPAGGTGALSKASILLNYPAYAKAIIAEQRRADVLHIRAPANISLLAMVLATFLKRPQRRWAKYAGDWSGGKDEPLSYRLQRFWLSRNLQGGVVTVNGSWQGQASHITSFLNPCLTEAEITEGRTAAERKQLESPVRMVFVGRLEDAKGPGVCLKIGKLLTDSGMAWRLDLIGEGEDRERYEQTAQKMGIQGNACFHGGLPRPALNNFFREAHFILLPTTCSEGWPKVLSEAMAYGAVPITTAISSIPQILEKLGAGQALASADPGVFASKILSYVKNPGAWKTESEAGARNAELFSYRTYLKNVSRLLNLPARQTPDLWTSDSAVRFSETSSHQA